jgi:hypothetical protein
MIDEYIEKYDPMFYFGVYKTKYMLHLSIEKLLEP